ncbi:uncharacterized protein LODBEIA_P06550 [Lodderomyces beijingensis]|uniref:Carboxymuconolactone decarboxylase-like domain-containing protein n=1 Tax=Lodderomyces beijingensis TaxID=1775926 RepID=A0ABP0ZE28_9ASCO
MSKSTSKNMSKNINKIPVSKTGYTGTKSKAKPATFLTPERLLRLAYHYPLLHNVWYLIATATLLELNLVEEIPAVLHFALRQQLYEFSNDEGKIVNNEYMLLLAEDSIKSSARCRMMYATGVKVPDILIPLVYYKHIPLNFKYTKGEDIHRKQQFIVDQVKEVVLKLVSMVGLPKVINALTLIRASTPSRLVRAEPVRPREIAPSSSSLGGEQTVDGAIDAASVNVKQIKFDLIQGSKLWNTVFSNHLGLKIKKQMLNAYPDLWYFVNNHIYSYLLSYNKYLSDKKTSLVVVACLVPQDVNPQLRGHLRGALNNGATKDEVSNTRMLSLEICQWLGKSWKEGIESVPKL